MMEIVKKIVAYSHQEVSKYSGGGRVEVGDDTRLSLFSETTGVFVGVNYPTEETTGDRGAQKTVRISFVVAVSSSLTASTERRINDLITSDLVANAIVGKLVCDGIVDNFTKTVVEFIFDNPKSGVRISLTAKV